MTNQHSKELAKRLRGVLLDGKAIAFSNVQEQIKDLSFEQATVKIHALNSLAALTFHLNYYVEGVNQVFEGGELTIRDKYSFDLPPLDQEKDWIHLRDRLLGNAEKFAHHVEQMSDEVLAGPFVKADYGTYQQNIEMMIEHCYYHFGQMVIIKKMIANS